MNKTKLTLALLLITQISFSQVFDDEIKKVIQSVSKQLNKNEKAINIAIYPFKHKKENEGVLAEYITDEFWNQMPQEALSFSLMDRATFDEYYQEHALKTEGLINPNTEKQFGMLIAADAYLTGKVYVFNSVINLKIKVTDTESGKIIATGSNKLPITYDIAEYMGIEGWKLKLKEAEKRKSSNEDCLDKKLGDICFENTTNKPITIKISDLGTLSSIYRSINVEPGDYGCFKDLPEKSYRYSFYEEDRKRGRSTISYGGVNGNFSIKKCQSDLIKI